MEKNFINKGADVVFEIDVTDDAGAPIDLYALGLLTFLVLYYKNKKILKRFSFPVGAGIDGTYVDFNSDSTDLQNGKLLFALNSEDTITADSGDVFYELRLSASDVAKADGYSDKLVNDIYCFTLKDTISKPFA
jgi:hypothetical protein